MIDECRDRTRCLHLVASGGRSAVTPSTEWTRLDGAFRQIPFGMWKVGRIAASGEPMEEPNLTEPFPEWVAHPDWMRAEGIRGFAGNRSSSAGKSLASWPCSLAATIGNECMGWLRMIADHAAAAIATARAFAGSRLSGEAGI